MTTRYHVSAPHPADHLLHVTVHVADTRDAQQLILRMPSWIPGSYLLREYARHVQAPRAHDAQGAPSRDGSLLAFEHLLASRLEGDRRAGRAKGRAMTALPTRKDEAFRYADLTALAPLWPVAVERTGTLAI